jgi:hypothetical protein
VPKVVMKYVKMGPCGTGLISVEKTLHKEF